MPDWVTEALPQGTAQLDSSAEPVVQVTGAGLGAHTQLDQVDAI
jgi:hypothetical protein